MSLFESIAFSEEYKEDSGFYVSVKNLNNKEVNRKPLSSWNLSKELSTSLIIRTSKPNYGNLENPETPEMYLVKIKYSVNPSAKELFLKKETQIFDNEAVLTKVFLRNVNNGSTQPLPIPNALYKDEFDLTITKSKGELISIKDSVKLLKSGDCLGIFDDSMQKSMLF
jgi:hypothetical protein